MTEQLTTRTLPLAAEHEKLGATMIERDGYLIPSSYGDPAAEYKTIREKGAGLIDLSSRGRIQVSGQEAVQFLNGLITNDMKTLAEGTWMPATFPNVQGRLIASVRVMRLRSKETNASASPTFLLDTEAATHERVFTTLQRFTLAGDFRVNDVTAETAQVTVQGKAAVDVIRSVAGDMTALAPNQVENLTWEENETTVIRSTHTGANGFDVIVGIDAAVELWESLLDAGATPVGHHALEVLRIEAGIPRYGVDMDEANVVSETNLDDAVSYTKGCYVGQEIIARIKYRGHVAKKLTGISTNQKARLKPADIILSNDEKEIGRITSATYSRHLNRTVALAYVKYDFLAAGTEVKVRSEGNEVIALIADLPFVRAA